MATLVSPNQIRDEQNQVPDDEVRIPDEEENVDEEGATDDNETVDEEYLDENEGPESDEEEDLDEEDESTENHVVRVAETGKSARPYLIRATASTLYAIIRELGQRNSTTTRKVLAKELESRYAGFDPQHDNETEVDIEVTFRVYTVLTETFSNMGAEIESIPYVEPEKVPRAKSSRSRKSPRECECGCGGMTSGGTWLPGHDAKRKSLLLKGLDQGNKENGEELVRRNWLVSGDMLARLARGQERQNAALTS